MDETTRRRLLLALPAAATACWALGPGKARAQGDYPNRAIRMVVPFPPGGPTDIVARPLGKLLGDALGHPVVIDNRGGAGGSVGAAAVATSPADGYTVLMGTVGTSAINRALYTKLPYDPIKDFTPIATAASAPVSIVANPGAGIASVQALVQRAKEKPGELTYGSAGTGTPGHLAGAMFCAAAGIRMLHVPYKGSAPAVSDLLGGQIQVMFDPLQSVLPHVQSGKLKLLAVTGHERAAVTPDAPTVAETVIPGFEMTAWWGVFAPAGLPEPIRQRLTAEVERIIRGDDYRKSLGSLGVTPLSVPLAALQQTELKKWGDAVQAAGIKAE